MIKKWHPLLLALLLSALQLPLFAASPSKTAEYTDQQLTLITRITAQLLSKNHYRQQPLDVNISRRLFDEYFHELDPNKIFFTEEDMRKFEPYRDTLWQGLAEGRHAFAFEVYDLFRSRNTDYRDFAEKLLRQEFDFSLDETYKPDRSKEPRAANRAELERLWYLRIKNDVLTYRLMNRIQAQEQAARAAAAAGEEASAQPEKIQVEPEEKVLNRLRDINNEVVKRDRVDILGTYLNSLAQVYGPHSSYYPPKQEEDFETAMKLSLSGIGATLTSEGGYIKVISLTPGGPAALDGQLQVEDRIIAVAQEEGPAVDVVDMPLSKAVQLIRGPEKSKVILTILPAQKGRNAAPESITIVRDKIQLVESQARGEVRTVEKDGKTLKIGVINLPSFYMDFDGAMKGDANFRSCSRDVREILEDFKRQGVDSVVMDLRRNGGGSLAEAINLTGLFINNGPVVQIKSSNQQVSPKYDTTAEQVYAGPLVVLTSKLSASAAEIFAAAIRDCDRGVIAGDSRTFGKGTVLDVVSLERYLKFLGEQYPAGSTTYETALFFRIAGGSVQQFGIQSDIVLPSFTDQMEVGEMFMSNHLPWDSVKPLQYERYIPDFDRKVAELKRRSEERVAADAEYAAFQAKLEIYNRFKDKKTVSLNEEVRWQEYENEKQIQDEAEKIYEERAGMSSGRRSNDLILNEAVQIAADFSLLG